MPFERFAHSRRIALVLRRVPAPKAVPPWLRDEDGHEGGDVFAPRAPQKAGERITTVAFDAALRPVDSLRQALNHRPN